jgi:hypothetical protein
MKLPDILRNRPLLFWAAVFLALPALLLALPLEWSNTKTPSIFHRDQPLDVYSERVDRIDRKLADGRIVRLTEKRLSQVRPMLQARRLLGAGPMSADEMRRALKLCREMNRQIARETRPASRDAVRQHWYDRLADELRRLDPKKVADELEQLRAQLARLVRLDGA